MVHNGLDLDLMRGEVLGVVGASGTGKSVMLKCILGILRPDSGEMEVGGKSVVGLGGAARDEYLRRFGMLFQGSALFDSMTVEENVIFPLDMFSKLNNTEKIKRVNLFIKEKILSTARGSHRSL